LQHFRREIAADNVKAAAGQPAGDWSAHAAKTNEPDLHLQLFLVLRDSNLSRSG
jgi:hypothetical protein